MSRQRELADHLRALSEINGILSAMKNLSLLETQKLSRFLAAQRRVVDSIEAVAADFFTFNPAALRHPDQVKPVYLIIGSERGFCGDFNRVLIEALNRHLQEASIGSPFLITVGHKLSVLVEEDRRVAARLGGPTVAEEVQAVLIKVMDTLRDLQAHLAPACPLDLAILHHGPDSGGTPIQIRHPFQHLRPQPAGFSSPPLLNLDALSFVTDLFDHYLFAVLHEVFYSSLMAENRRRFQHMDQAIQRLEKEISELQVKRNVLRQEDITEEIEVIMLSAEALRKI